MMPFTYSDINLYSHYADDEDDRSLISTLCEAKGVLSVAVGFL